VRRVASLAPASATHLTSALSDTRSSLAPRSQETTVTPTNGAKLASNLICYLFVKYMWSIMELVPFSIPLYFTYCIPVAACCIQAALLAACFLIVIVADG
jgi:hypothetical protein